VSIGDDQNDQELAGQLAASGAELAGAALGATIGIVTGGPLGAVAGAPAGIVAAYVLNRVGAEMQKRVLGPRQRVRIGAAFAFARAEISARILAGETPRDDGFFTSRPGRWQSPASELLEGVLIAAADAYEERKVRHLGSFYASLAFDATVPPADAHHLLHLAERLSFRQLCCIEFFANPRPPDALIELTSSEETPFVRGDAVSAELDDLAQALVIGLDNAGAILRPVGAYGTYGSSDFRQLGLARVRVSQMGEAMRRLMRLSEISAADIDRLYSELGGASPPR
jgi:hypothetical protein